MKQQLFDYINTQRRHMLTLLEKLVLIQSGSYNKPGVDQVVRLIQDVLAADDIAVREIPQENYGAILIASSRAAGEKNNILLIGHTDTVFPQNTNFNWWREDHEKAYGPGVIDMKGGLVTGIYALKALKHVGLLDRIPIRFIFNPDEEIGSPCSRDIIVAEARKSVMAFVLECGGLDGQVVTGRKGYIGVKLEVFGKAGHAAFITENKASAIVALAHKILALEALNGQFDGVTVNVGRISGGIGSNTVPEYAVADVDVRFSTTAGAEFFEKQRSALARQTNVPGTSTRLEMIRSRPPMEQSKGNRALFRMVAEQARELHVPIQEEFRQGVSDANIVALEGTPVLDGLGPIGSLDHSDQEFMITESLFQRTQLLAWSLLEGWQRYQAGTLW
ncbi:peptidase M20 [Candidatus Vecturithrix granuli]|uniref:Peptidase M20 n=1 Tax=Vecturithrix granuli TaxID=1499967 RepID=A0A0S6W9E5_VECG1|nr:peptidase M20 [Candidatus Vecturithrix granuli]